MEYAHAMANKRRCARWSSQQLWTTILYSIHTHTMSQTHTHTDTALVNCLRAYIYFSAFQHDVNIMNFSIFVQNIQLVWAHSSPPTPALYIRLPGYNFKHLNAVPEPSTVYTVYAFWELTHTHNFCIYMQMTMCWQPFLGIIIRLRFCSLCKCSVLYRSNSINISPFNFLKVPMCIIYRALGIYEPGWFLTGSNYVKLPRAVLFVLSYIF